MGAPATNAPSCGIPAAMAAAAVTSAASSPRLGVLVRSRRGGPSPRSCPSVTPLQYHRLPVLAEDIPQSVGDLAERGLGLHRLDDERHEVVLAPRRRAHRLDRRARGVAVALLLECLEALDLARLERGVDLHH